MVPVPRMGRPELAARAKGVASSFVNPALAALQTQQHNEFLNVKIRSIGLTTYQRESGLHPEL